MIYGIVCFALIWLRKKNAGETGYFKIPYGNIIAIAGITVTIWLLSSSKLTELRDVAIAVAAGLIIYFLVNISKKRNG
jgi:amino acid transporter